MTDYEPTPTDGAGKADIGGGLGDGTGRPDDAAVERLLGSTLDHQAVGLYAGDGRQREQSWAALQRRQRRIGWSRNLMFAAAAFLVVLIGAGIAQKGDGGSDGMMASVGGDLQTTMSTTPASTAPAPTSVASTTMIPDTTSTTTASVAPVTNSTAGPLAPSTTTVCRSSGSRNRRQPPNGTVCGTGCIAQQPLEGID